MRPYIILVFVMVFLAAAGEARQDKISISGPDGREAQVSRNSEGYFKFVEGKKNYVLEKDSKGVLTFKEGKKPVAQGSFKGNKLVMKTPKKNVFLSLKTQPGKIQFRPGSGSEWEFNAKPDNIVVTSNGVEYGRITYYSGKGKIKVKNRMDNPVVEVTGYSHLCSAPGVYLIDGLKQDSQAFMVLLMFTMGR